MYFCFDALQPVVTSISSAKLPERHRMSRARVPQHDDPLRDTESLSQQRFNGNPSPRTLERWRTQGSGPSYVKVGRKVFYRDSAVDQWLDEQTRSHTRENGGKSKREDR